MLPGNEELREHLLALALREGLHHCLLFEGPAGLGKAATARWLAKAINCTGAGRDPCEACWSCRAIASAQHPDIIEIGLDPERTAPIISVRQAREVLSRLTLHPCRARMRLVIIDPAAAMKTEAANALLKTFEEPPASTGFILVTPSARRLLPTVRSRGQRVRFRPLSTARLAAWLEARGVEEASWIAQLADGCPGRALDLAEGEAAAWRTERDLLLETLSGPISGMFRYSEKLTRGNRAVWTARVQRMLDALERLNRDALLRSTGARQEWLYSADRIDVIDAWAEALDCSGCAAIAAAIARTRLELTAYVNGRLMLDTLLTRVATELGRARSVGSAQR